MGIENNEVVGDKKKHSSEKVMEFNPDEAQKRVEAERARLAERENGVEHYGSPLEYIEENGLNDPNTLETIIQEGDFDAFKKHLVNMNGLMRNLDIATHRVDGESVIIPQGLTPISPELKDGVLEEMFDAMKEIESPRDRGALAYHTLGMLHLFSDGNGRSQRVWQQLFSKKRLTEGKMRVITEHGIGDTGEMGRRKMGELLNTQTSDVSTKINDFAFEFDFDGATGVRVDAFQGEPVFSDEATAGSSIDELDRIKNIFDNDRDSLNFSFPEMAATILGSEDESFGLPESYMDQHNRLMYKANDEKGFSALFNFRSSDQVKRFIEIHNQLKLKQFRTMIEAFKNPQNYKYNNVDVTLVDVLERPSFPR